MFLNWEALCGETGFFARVFGLPNWCPEITFFDPLKEQKVWKTYKG